MADVTEASGGSHSRGEAEEQVQITSDDEESTEAQNIEGEKGTAAVPVQEEEMLGQQRLNAAGTPTLHMFSIEKWAHKLIQFF
jgi:hypothetical protein